MSRTVIQVPEIKVYIEDFSKKDVIQALEKTHIDLKEIERLGFKYVYVVAGANQS